MLVDALTSRGVKTLRHLCPHGLSRLITFLTPKPGYVVRTATGAKYCIAEYILPKREGLEVFFDFRVELGPPARVLFRPEEIHPAS